MMSVSLKLRCNNCGHEWKSRGELNSGMRQCTKCRSRSISEIPEDEQNALPVGDSSTPRRTISQDYIDMESAYSSSDPEIVAKIRELQLARLERQIAEERRPMMDDAVMMRVVFSQKRLLQSLHDRKLLKDDEFEWLESLCPWCGSEDMVSEEIKEGFLGWRCNECGREVV